MANFVNKTTIVMGNVKATQSGQRGTIGVTVFPESGAGFRCSASCHWYDPSDAEIYQNSVTAIVPAGGSYDTHEDDTNGQCEYTWFVHAID